MHRYDAKFHQFTHGHGPCGHEHSNTLSYTSKHASLPSTVMVLSDIVYTSSVQGFSSVTILHIYITHTHRDLNKLFIARLCNSVASKLKLQVITPH